MSRYKELRRIGQIGYVSPTAGRIKIRSDRLEYIHENKKALRFGNLTLERALS